MTDIYKAINAQIEILHLKNRIKSLQDVVCENITLAEKNNPDSVVVDPRYIQAAIVPANYVGHKLIYRDVEINLHTDGREDRVGKKIFKSLFK